MKFIKKILHFLFGDCYRNKSQIKFLRLKENSVVKNFIICCDTPYALSLNKSISAYGAGTTRILNGEVAQFFIPGNTIVTCLSNKRYYCNLYYHVLVCSQGKMIFGYIPDFFVETY